MGSDGVGFGLSGMGGPSANGGGSINGGVGAGLSGSSAGVNDWVAPDRELDDWDLD